MFCFTISQFLILSLKFILLIIEKLRYESYLQEKKKKKKNDGVGQLLCVKVEYPIDSTDKVPF